MPIYGKGDKVTFTGEFVAELLGVVGIVLKRRISDEGHYVYDIKIQTRLPIDIPGVKLSASGVLSNVPGGWLELFR
jgi:hypothetical protein